MDHGGAGMAGQAEMDELMGMKGRAFDLAFVEMMIVHHEGAIDMARTELRNGSLPEVKRLASQVITDQQKEIDQMTAWQNSWAS